MVGDPPEPESEPSVQAPPSGEDRLGAPEREHDEAFTALYTEFMPTLVRFLRWQGVPLVAAAEIAQETMAELYGHWATVRNQRAWARKVASRRWARRIATGRDQDSAGFDYIGNMDDLADTSTLITADQIRAFEHRYDFLRLLDTLPSRQRQVLAWTYDGYTPTEIAEELHLTPENVRANLLKARRAAAAYLREERR